MTTDDSGSRLSQKRFLLDITLLRRINLIATRKQRTILSTQCQVQLQIRRRSVKRTPATTPRRNWHSVVTAAHRVHGPKFSRTVPCRLQSRFQSRFSAQWNPPLKGCCTVQKIAIEIVIEICMEQTLLFQCNRFHYADFRD